MATPTESGILENSTVDTQTGDLVSLVAHGFRAVCAPWQLGQPKGTVMQNIKTEAMLNNLYMECLMWLTDIETDYEWDMGVTDTDHVHEIMDLTGCSETVIRDAQQFAMQVSGTSEAAAALLFDTMVDKMDLF